MRLLPLLYLLRLAAEGTAIFLDDFTKDDVDNINMNIRAFDVAAMNEPDINPRDADPRNVLKRSTDAALSCRAILPSPPTGGKWLFSKAECIYPFSVSSRFRTQCQAETEPDNIRTRIPGNCNTVDSEGRLVRRICFQHHDYNEVGAPAFDILCSDPRGTLKWSLKDGSNMACSREWTNQDPRRRGAEVEVIVNVLDSTQTYAVAPGIIYFLIDGFKIGHEKGGEAYHNSGRILIPPGMGGKACVQPKESTAQILSIFGSLKSLRWVA